MDTLLQLYPYGGVMLSGRAAWTGYSFGWQEVKLNLTNYMLNAYDLRFRFIFESDSFTSLDGFSLDDFSLTGSTSLNAISSESEFQIYPNPTNDFLYVNSLFEAKQTAEFKIYTVEGKEVFGDRLSFENETLIDVSNLKNGLYLLQIQSENGSVCSYKFIKN
ncbi:MAG: T9SS type A sorting domain-containing protein [Bacteroidetes bacterium]|nr:T9SS type A sorting domain-containing protein [Bacteroidota bacterium]